jgi:hypothetical protein
VANPTPGPKPADKELSVPRRTIAACTIAAATVAVTFVGATPASADDGGGVYFCYNQYDIEVYGVAKLPYVTPAAVTTDPNYCPPGTYWVGVG